VRFAVILCTVLLGAGFVSCGIKWGFHETATVSGIALAITLAIAIAFALYFLPSVLAWKFRHKNVWALFAFNLLLGGTLVFGMFAALTFLLWLLCLTWACTALRRK